MEMTSIAPVVEGFKIYLVLSQLHKISSPIHTRISERAQLTPHALAVRHGMTDLSYEELDHRSNIIAHYLLSRGIRNEDCIGVHLQESILIPVAVLGIMKAGATYVPLSAELPENRINRIIDDASIRLVFTDDGKSTLFSAGLCPVQELDRELHLLPDHDTSLPDVRTAHEDAAYIIYTSGSTGDPKGVIVSHGSMTNYLDWYLEDLRQQSGAGLPLTSSISFAAGVTQLFSALLLGEPLHIIDRSTVRQPELLLDWYRQHPDHALYCVPTLWEEVMNYAESHRDRTLVPPACLYLSGESLPKSLVDRSFRYWPGLRIWNLYGPTEATANVSYYKVEKDREIYLGKPIRGARLVLLDEHLQPVPNGEEGFIYVTSQALAREYRNKPELSRRSFITDHNIEGFEGCTLYNTGDIGRFTADNELLFLGRKDQQVKIRGHRIELSEVERYIQSVAGVRQAACKVMADSSGTDRIHAFIVGSEGAQLSVDAVREELLLQLPGYMIPEVFHFLEAMPKLGNGKINRQQLDPGVGDTLRPGLSYAYVAPATEEERMLLDIWAEVLEVKEPGMLDDFFDLGGHSLKMVRLANSIRHKMGRDIPVQHLWEHTTPAALLTFLHDHTGSAAAKDGIPRQTTVKKSVPLSIHQSGLWFTLQSRPRLTAYNMVFTLSLSGNATPERVQEVLTQMLERHDILRSGFRIESMNPVRFILDAAQAQVSYTDLSRHNADERAAYEASLCERLFQQTPDLAEDSLISFHLLQHSGTEHKLIVYIHHILFDGVSIGIFSEEFAALWNKDGRKETAPTYGDYAQWEKKNYFDEKLSPSRSFWKQQLEGGNYFLNLPTDKPRPKVQEGKGSNRLLLIDTARLKALERFNRDEKSTSFIVLLSVFQLLLHRYTREEDIFTGVPFANRTHGDTRSIMGFFVNTVVYRTRCSPELRFRELMHNIRSYTANALEHQSYPFSRLVEQLNPERSVSYHPLFQVMFAYHDKLAVHTTNDGLQIRAEEIQNPGCKFDLEIEAQEHDNHIAVRFHYDTELFEAATIDRMTEQFRYLLDQALQRPDAAVGSYRLEAEAQLLQKLAGWNDTAFPVMEGCLHQQFERQAAAVPDRVAVSTANASLSYRELNEQANQIAHALREKGIQPDEPVGIIAQRSAEMLAGILGILKAGAAYLPIDPQVPAERLRYTIDNSRIRLLLAHNAHTDLSDANIDVLPLGDRTWYANCPTGNPKPAATPENLAYVIYTSGSTGQPKGVMIEHRAAMNRIAWMQRSFPLYSSDVILQKTTVTFDVSVWELFWWFFAGTSVHLPELGAEKNPESLIATIAAQQVSTMHFVPSMLSTFLEYVQEHRIPASSFASLKHVFTSGEALEKHHVERFNRLIAAGNDTRLINLYGPTEATVDVSCFDCAETGRYSRVPIGRPIDNIQLYILDSEGHPLPEKVPGELCIGGVGLARGYLNNAQLTEERFFNSSFGRLYRSGDLARWLPDGNIEYLGRTDHQVKVRGFRIELGEIENSINRHPDVETSAALVKKTGYEDLRLVAYFVPRKGKTNIDIKTYLRAFLPDYMIPSAFVQMDALPLLTSGKLDIRALPEPFEGQQKVIGQRSYNNEYEQRLAAVWTQVLRHDAFDTEDNFYDAGGHSLLLVKMKLTLDTEFNMNIPLVDLFQYPTIRSLAEVIASRTRQNQRAGIADRARLQRAASSLKRP